MPPKPYTYTNASDVKFGELLRNGSDPLSFQQGDVFVHPTGVRFCIEYNASGKAVEHRAVGAEARGLLTEIGAHLTMSNGARLYASGPTQFTEVAELLRPHSVHPQDSKFWQHWHVWRNGGDLGTMAEMRQRWHEAKVAAAAGAATPAATKDNDEDAA